MKLRCLLAAIGLLCGCVFNRPDHFYVLNTGQSKTLDPRSTFSAQITLRITLPVLVDRSELVMVDAQGVQILEHERWAAPLADQFTTVLGQDIEARREDVILSSRRIAQPGVPNVTIVIDIVQLNLQKESGVRMEARWRLDDGNDKVAQGRETFVASASDGSIGALTRDIDACVGQLADRLVAQLPR